MEECISLISSRILCVWHPENPLFLLVDLLSTITICSYCYFCGFKMSLIHKREDVNRFENNMLICLNYTPVYCTVWKTVQKWKKGGQYYFSLQLLAFVNPLIIITPFHP